MSFQYPTLRDSGSPPTLLRLRLTEHGLSEREVRDRVKGIHRLTARYLYRLLSAFRPELQEI